MSRISSKGACRFCHRVLSKAGMTKHLETCPQRTEAGETDKKKTTRKTNMVYLLAEGRDQPQYWMHLEFPASTTLESLDNFLRATWLECCGHLSKFEIGGISYASYPDPEFGDKSMRAQVGSVLSPGEYFLHEYDYGTTTELRLKVISKQAREAKEKSIQILARNEAPIIACQVCGKPATNVCTECIDEESGGWLCDTCAEEHECGEEMLLPVVNSPRVGMCGYTGPAE